MRASGRSLTVYAPNVLVILTSISLFQVNGFGWTHSQWSAPTTRLSQSQKLDRRIFIKKRHTILRETEDSNLSLEGVKTLGVDFGTVRTGIAVTVGYAPSPLTILQHPNVTDLSREIIRLAQAENANQIVIGLPLHKNGTMSEQANITTQFAHVLSSSSHARFGPNFPVYLFDERYSSKEAEARIRSANPTITNSFQLSGTLDADSACIILEHFYATYGEGRKQVFPPPGVLDACQLAWELQQKEEQRAMDLYNKDREMNLNAKQDAIRRANILEQQMEQDGTLRKKGKKKKKKKRKGNKWLTL